MRNYHENEKAIIEIAQMIIDNQGSVTPDEINAQLRILSEKKGIKHNDITEEIATLLAIAHRQGDLAADYGTKKVSIYRKINP